MTDAERSAFLGMAIEDLKGKPKVVEHVVDSSPAMAGFVDMATKDLMGESSAPAVNTNSQLKLDEDKKSALKDAFAQSLFQQNQNQGKPIVEKAIDDFKKEADTEAQDVLSKLLKGMK